jgi:diguanylate cyclase (GGDEF)-like protein
LDLTKYRKALAESDEIKKTTYQDELTGIPNHYSCDQIFYKYSTEDSVRHVGCALIVIDNLVAINDEFGREAGNIAIIDFCHILQDVGEEFGFIGRNGGNEFLLVIEQCDKRIMEKFFSKLKVRMERYNALELNHPIDFRYEYVLNEDLKLQRFSNMITEVYQRVYE